MDRQVRDIMYIIRLAFCLAVVLVMSITVASAKDTTFRVQESGSFILQGTPVDTNGDGATATLVIEDGVFRSGTLEQVSNVSTQAALEYSPDVSPATCPSGNPGIDFPLVSGAVVTRVEAKGLLNIKADSGVTCFDPTNNTFFGIVNGTIEGGTGQFSGATGSVEINFEAKVLVGDPTKNQGFGSSVTTFEGTITD